MADDPKPITGVPQVDDYLRERLTDKEQRAVRGTIEAGDPAAGLAIVNEANRRNESGQPRT